MAATKDVRITEPYMLQRIDAARVAAGEKSSTKTAARLIIERLAQLELVQAVRPPAAQPTMPFDAHASALAS